MEVEVSWDEEPVSCVRGLTVTRGCVGGRVAGLRVRTATPLSAGEAGRASGEGESETETMGERIVTGPMHIVMGFST